MLIVDMQMPKNCSECTLKMDEQTCFNGKGVFGIEVQRMSWCPIKGEISEIELMHLEEERAFAARNIAAERSGNGTTVD